MIYVILDFLAKLALVLLCLEAFKGRYKTFARAILAILAVNFACLYLDVYGRTVSDVFMYIAMGLVFAMFLLRMELWSRVVFSDLIKQRPG